MSLRSATLLLALAACGDTGAPAFQAPVYARGGAATVQAGAWTVTLTRAEVALGPVYLCATAAASSDLCPSAVAELTDVAAVDALAPAAQELGVLDIVPGEVRSAMLDYGITWLPTETRPTAKDGAPAGHSARFAGTAVQGDMSLEFTADVDLAPPLQGGRTIEGLQLPRFTPAPGGSLRITVDAASWWIAVDFDALAAEGPGPHTLAPDSAAVEAVRFGMIAAPPRLTWSTEETP